MKSLACSDCRSRKVSCDRVEPSCGRCSSAGKKCRYPVRKERGVPHSSRVKDLQIRLAQVETRLLSINRTQNVNQDFEEDLQGEEDDDAWQWCDSWPWEENVQTGEHGQSILGHATENPTTTSFTTQYTHVTPTSSIATATKAELTPKGDILPVKEVQEELYAVYFQQVHPSTPMIHRGNFFKKVQSHARKGPFAALRFAVMAVAALKTEKYRDAAEAYYQKGRRVAEEMEMRGKGEELLSLAAVQCWFLLASYEADQSQFLRAWIDVGRCVKLAQIQGLHRIDDVDDRQVKPNLPRHQTEMEECRRTFWASYTADRWASTLSNRSFIYRDEEISTHLPSSETAFENDMHVQGFQLQDAFNDYTPLEQSPFAAVIFATAILGRSLELSMFRTASPTTDMISEKFWEQHRVLDNWIAQIFIELPHTLTLFGTVTNSNILFFHLNLHSTIIMLHQQAIRMVEKQGLSPLIAQRSFQRCLISAQHVKTTIISCLTGTDPLVLSMWTSHCLYVSGEIFIQDTTQYHFSASSAADFRLVLMALTRIDSKFSKYFSDQLTRQLVELEFAGNVS